LRDISYADAMIQKNRSGMPTEAEIGRQELKCSDMPQRTRDRGSSRVARLTPRPEVADHRSQFTLLTAARGNRDQSSERTAFGAIRFGWFSDVALDERFTASLANAPRCQGTGMGSLAYE
jgi:hypothetical protein